MILGAGVLVPGVGGCPAAAAVVLAVVSCHEAGRMITVLSTGTATMMESPVDLLMAEIILSR